MAPAAAEPVVGLLLAGGASSRLGRDKAQLVLPGSRQTLAENARSILEEAGLEVVVAARDLARAEILLPGCGAVADGPGRGPAAALLGAHEAFPDSALIALACDMPLVPPSLLRLLSEIAGDWVVPAWMGGGNPLAPLRGAEGERGAAARFRWWRPRTAATTGYPLAPLRGADSEGEPEGRSPSLQTPHPEGELEGRSPSLQIGSPPSPSAERGAGGRGPSLRLEPLCALYRPAALEALARRVAAGRYDLHGLADEAGITFTPVGHEQIAEFGDPAAIFRNINEQRDLDAFAALRQPPCRPG